MEDDRKQISLHPTPPARVEDDRQRAVMSRSRQMLLLLSSALLSSPRLPVLSVLSLTLPCLISSLLDRAPCSWDFSLPDRALKRLFTLVSLLNLFNYISNVFLTSNRMQIQTVETQVNV